MDTCATCPPYSRGCADEPTSTSFVDRGCEGDGAEERAYEGQLHGRPQIVISRDRKGRSNMLPRRTASTGVTGCPARPQSDRNPFKVTGGCAGEWKLERQPGKVGCDVKTQKRTRHMHRWMSTTALDWRGRARGGRWRLAAHVRGAAARDGRLWPSPVLPALFPVLFPSTSCSGWRPSGASQWPPMQAPPSALREPGTAPRRVRHCWALHCTALQQAFDVPSHPAYPSNLKWNLEGCAGGGLTGAASCLALPCPALVPARLDGPPRYARPVRQPSFHPLHSATYSSWTSIGIHASPTGQRERVESTLGASSPSNSSRLPPPPRTPTRALNVA